MPAAGGGILLDFGSHLIDQALVLFGPVATVYGDVAADERFFAVLEHEGGMTSHISGDWRQGAPGPRFRVRGSEGSYVVYGMDGQEEALIAGRTPATDGDWGSEPPERWGRMQRGDTSEPVPSERGRWDTYYPAFSAAVRGERPVPVDPHDAIASLTVIDAIKASAEQHRAHLLYACCSARGRPRRARAGRDRGRAAVDLFEGEPEVLRALETATVATRLETNT